MQAPQQERHAAHQIKQDDRSHGLRPMTRTYSVKILLSAHVVPCTGAHNPKVGLMVIGFLGAAQHEVVRCRTGIATSAASGTIPDQRCTTACCTASGKRRRAYGSSSVSQ